MGGSVRVFFKTHIYDILLSIDYCLVDIIGHIIMQWESMRPNADKNA